MPYNAKAAVQIAVALAVIGLVAGILMPIAIGPIAGDTTTTETQDIDETVELHDAGLEATLDDTTDGSDAEYTVEYDGETETTTVDVDANETITVGGVDVTIEPTEATADNATTDYSYPTTVGWGSASTLWDVTPVIIVLGVVLMVIGVGLKAFRTGA